MTYHTYERVMSHIWMSHVTCHTYERVMSHIWTSQVTCYVTHMNEWCHVFMCNTLLYIKQLVVTCHTLCLTLFCQTFCYMCHTLCNMCHTLCFLCHTLCFMCHTLWFMCHTICFLCHTLCFLLSCTGLLQLVIDWILGLFWRYHLFYRALLQKRPII